MRENERKTRINKIKKYAREEEKRKVKRHLGRTVIIVGIPLV